MKTKEVIRIEEDDTLYNQYIKLKPFLRVIPAYEKQITAILGHYSPTRILPGGREDNPELKELIDLRFSVHCSFRSKEIEKDPPKKLSQVRKDWTECVFKIGKVDGKYLIIVWMPNETEYRPLTFKEFITVYSSAL